MAKTRAARGRRQNLINAWVNTIDKTEQVLSCRKAAVFLHVQSHQPSPSLVLESLELGATYTYDLAGSLLQLLAAPPLKLRSQTPSEAYVRKLGHYTDSVIAFPIPSFLLIASISACHIDAKTRQLLCPSTSFLSKNAQLKCFEILSSLFCMLILLSYTHSGLFIRLVLPHQPFAINSSPLRLLTSNMYM